MADVSKIRVDGVDYDIKDNTARTEVTPIERGGTGNTTAINAINALLKRSTLNLNNQSNVNTILDTGVRMVYFEDSSFDISTLNLPAKYGILFVLNAAPYISQIFFNVASGTYHYRTSVNSGTTWTDWRKLYDSNNNPLPTVTTSDNGKILKVVNGVWTAVAE